MLRYRVGFMLAFVLGLSAPASLLHGGERIMSQSTGSSAAWLETFGGGGSGSSHGDYPGGQSGSGGSSSWTEWLKLPGAIINSLPQDNSPIIYRPQGGGYIQRPMHEPKKVTPIPTNAEPIYRVDTPSNPLPPMQGGFGLRNNNGQVDDDYFKDTGYAGFDDPSQEVRDAEAEARKRMEEQEERERVEKMRREREERLREAELEAERQAEQARLEEQRRREEEERKKAEAAKQKEQQKEQQKGASGGSGTASTGSGGSKDGNFSGGQSAGKQGNGNPQDKINAGPDDADATLGQVADEPSPKEKRQQWLDAFTGGDSGGASNTGNLGNGTAGNGTLGNGGLGNNTASGGSLGDVLDGILHGNGGTQGSTWPSAQQQGGFTNTGHGGNGAHSNVGGSTAGTAAPAAPEWAEDLDENEPADPPQQILGGGLASPEHVSGSDPGYDYSSLIEEPEDLAGMTSTGGTLLEQEEVLDEEELATPPQDIGVHDASPGKYAGGGSHDAGAAQSGAIDETEQASLPKPVPGDPNYEEYANDWQKLLDQDAADTVQDVVTEEAMDEAIEWGLKKLSGPTGAAWGIVDNLGDAVPHIAPYVLPNYVDCYEPGGYHDPNLCISGDEIKESHKGMLKNLQLPMAVPF